jgi:hypothetical protein
VSIEIRQVVKQYLMSVPGISHTVQARISHSELNDFYHWEISHHYRPAGAADFYLPPRVDLHSLAECESLLRTYMRAFTADVKVNEDY